MKIKIILFLGLMVFFVNTMYAQQISGTVYDAETRLPLTAVLIEIGERKTQTDSLGKFEISGIGEKLVIVAKRIGYKTDQHTLQLPLKTKLEIFLQPMAQQLEDVVVSTGYQDIPKDRATGSFTKVDNAVFNQQVTPGIIERLEGITSSLTVDRRTNSPSIMIRGLSTLRLNRGPLIVLDNFPYEGDINNINPADVESITVLKDAAASSIWGAKAANGVIVITTKKGKFNQPLTVQFNVASSWMGKPNLGYNARISSADQIAVEQLLFAKGYYTSAENSTTKPVQSPVVELLIVARDGLITQQKLQKSLNVFAGQAVNKNYADAFYSGGLNTQYNLTMQGGSATHNWNLLGGYDDNITALGATYKRTNLKLDNYWKPLKNLELGISLGYSQTDTKSGRPTLASFYTGSGQLPVYTQFLDVNGNELPVMKDYSLRYTGGSAANSLLNWDYYPIMDAKNSFTTNGIRDLLANFKLNYKLLDGLKLSLNYQYEWQQTQNNGDNKLSSYYTRNLINQFTQVNGTVLTRPVPLGSILDERMERLTVNNGRAQLNYDRAWKDFTVNVLAGGEIRDAMVNTENFRSYGFDPETGVSVPVDYFNSYKNFITGSSAYITDKTGHSGAVTKYVSLYANGAVSYKGRYTLSGSARRDASNLFGVAANNLWNPLWSAGVAWTISEEAFAKDLPYLRLRFTYGSSGNSDSRFSAVTTTSYSGISNYTRTAQAIIFNYANPDLKWEVTKTVNFGLDFKFLNNRISGSLEYYHKKSMDLIGTEPIDYTAGVGFSVTRNVAIIGAGGFDLELRSLNTTGQFKWTTDFFMNTYKDKIKKYYLNNDLGSNLVNGNSNISGIVGMPVYAVYGYKWGGLNPQNGNPQGYLNGQLSEDYLTLTGSSTKLNDLQYIGPAFPVSSGALGNGLAWRNFNFNIRLSYKFGHYFRRPSLSYAGLYASRNGLAEYGGRWQKSGDELNTNVPSQIYPAVGSRDDLYTYSEATVVSADLIRLQYIGFGYTLTKATIKKLPFKNIAIQFTANNLGLLWRANDQHLDPDYPIELPLKIYSLNLKINL